jgi:exodeoxyribonuclease-5
MTYNSKQIQAINMASSLKHKVCYISGAPGTGKSTCLKQIIENIGANGSEIVVMAPSHKAKQVIEKTIDDKSLEYMTVQKYCGLKPKINSKTGIQTFVEEFNPKEQTCDVAVVDEASMLTQKMLDKVMRTSNHVILLGDIHQLEAIEDPIPEQTLSDIPVIELTEQMRQKSIHSDLYKVIQIFLKRKNNNTTRTFNFDTESDGSIIVHKDLSDFIDTFIESKSTSKRIIGFRNVSIDYINSEIRSKLSLPDYPIVGDIIVLQQPITRRGKKNNRVVKEIVYNNGDELTIKKITPVDNNTDYPTFMMAECIRHGDMETREIKIPYDSIKFNNNLQKLANSINNGTNKRLWTEKYYPLKESVAHYKFNYCGTTHKAQGSTYDEVYILHKDMIVAGDNYNRLMYVAISRAKTVAHIKD